MEVENDDSNLDLVGDPEMQARTILQNRVFALTKAFDKDLLQKTCINVDFANAGKAICMSDFANVYEAGSRHLTIKFICTLQETNDSIASYEFWIKVEWIWCVHCEKFRATPCMNILLHEKNLSLLLGFHKRCCVDLETATLVLISEVCGQAFWVKLFVKKPTTMIFKIPPCG